ncbi:MAG: ATPase domain-containing protein [Methanobacteriota archaeon]
MVERTLTGIPGLDEMIGGGIPKGHTVLISGGPGTGKSTFAMQFLYNGAVKYNEPGVFISLEEKPEDLVKNFSKYGWDLSRVNILSVVPTKFVTSANLRKGRFTFKTEKGFREGEFSMDFLREIIKDKVEKTKAKRVVLDSISALSLHLEKSFMVRQEVLSTVLLLSELGATSMITTETPEGRKGMSRFGVEEFVSQGVIGLYNIKLGSKRVRGLEILKMRGTKHSQNICLMSTSDEGIVVYPKENLYSE